MLRKISKVILGMLVTVLCFMGIGIKNGSYELTSYAATSDWDTHWAYVEIRSAMGKGWVNEAEIFRPNDSITRAEFVKIFNMVFILGAPSGKVFSDTSTHWAKREIEAAVANGVCNGKTATEFKPDDPITREEAAVMISNYKKISDGNLDKLSKYTDANQVSSWAKNSVEGVIEKGYMGAGGIVFNPKATMTRAEAVVALGRIASSKSILSKPVLAEVITSSQNNNANANISWEAVTGASGYELYRITSSTGTYTLITTTTETSYNDTGLTTNSTYYYKVIAYTTVGTEKVYSDFSSDISVPTPTHPNSLFRKQGGDDMSAIIYRNSGVVTGTNYPSHDLEIYIENSQVYITLHDIGFVINGKRVYGLTTSYGLGSGLDVIEKSTGKILYHKERTDS